MRTPRKRSPCASSKKSTASIPRQLSWCCRAAIVSRAEESWLLNDTDGPEVVGEIVIAQVGIRNGEVSAHAPIRAPGIAHQEARGGVVVSDRHHGVPAQRAFRIRGHRD